ncbi:class I SAM-dependent methyltransferase [Paenibacillus sp. MWE-103]|uniref:Class I SAM-dependent methyltransferase n=1 Tax=Paenibacillus artemisiicola TaxID=1172618 RepID=A0ABS3W4P7_9BACL|nr:class I SAM-dependent methyltransferase [Paenibacillus artemisiicola]MBO7743110.1 class I SAM-dependent methyltransferase [Paenibacillus artemisiicola]
MNPFLTIADPRPLGPGSYHMALPLVEAVRIRPGVRVLEVGAGNGQVASILAKHWAVTVVTLEPWLNLSVIRDNAAGLGVANQVLPMNVTAQSMPFASETFDAVISIGSFEMIRDDRPQALEEMMRVARSGAYVGIAEPMCHPCELTEQQLQTKIGQSFHDHFRTLDWNKELFHQHGLSVVENYYFSDAYQWWYDHVHDERCPLDEREFVVKDAGKWLSLGLVVGRKP